jgi:hypothetical protein
MRFKTLGEKRAAKVDSSNNIIIIIITKNNKDIPLYNKPQQRSFARFTRER